MKQQPNYYSIIPADVRYDKSLKANEKLLYGEITALSNQKGFCWAENIYFANLFGVSKATVSRWVSNLEKNGYVRTELIYGKNKQVEERRIYIADPLLTKSSIPPRQNNQYPIDENVKEELNNTRTNITSINNDNDNGAEREHPHPQNPKPETKEPDSENSKLVHQFYQDNFGLESPYIAQELEYWVEDLNVELVLEALKRTKEYGGEFGYAKRIMKSWADKGIDDMEKVKQADVEFENKNKKKYNRRNNFQKKESLPDWAKDNSNDLVTQETNAADEQEVISSDEDDISARLERLRQFREEQQDE